MKRILQICLLGAGAYAGYVLGAGGWFSMSRYFAFPWITAMIGLAAGYFASAAVYRFVGQKLVKLEQKLDQLPGDDLFIGSAGWIGGLLVSFLLYPAWNSMDNISGYSLILFSVIMGYAGFYISYRKKEDLKKLWSSRRVNESSKVEERSGGEHKILDTSVIIDGRIADLCKTGFIEGVLVIPGFVLEELQHIADSSDLLKRNRGRRGLDILNKIRKELDIQVQIYEGDFEEIAEVDSKLVKLAKLLEGKVVTNDFNLNKVCELQGVEVLNINDLANAVKPIVLPGEELMVQVIKDGKEHGQGVAYLDDGTMIVVEEGREYIGSRLEVLVTSVLQTSAGRMIFAKPKLMEKAL